FNRTLNGNTPCTGAQQSWGWMYQILPFLEQTNLWSYYRPDTNPNDLQFQGDNFILGNMPKTYNCPSRRMGVLSTDPYPWNGQPVQRNSTGPLGRAAASLGLERLLVRVPHGDLFGVERMLLGRVEEGGPDASRILEALVHGYLRHLQLDKALTD